MQLNTHTAYLSLGSNLGDRIQNIHTAIELLKPAVGELLQQSSLYITEPWGNKMQPAFINSVANFQTNLNADDLLNTIMLVEKKMGRERTEKWKERIIDIDILFFDNLIIEKPNLTTPHKHLHERKFTLIPMAEIAPDMIHPLLKKTIKELLQICPDDGDVKRI